MGSHFSRDLKSEEDIDLSDEEDDSRALGNDESLERASVTDRSIRSATDRNITKVSSTRKLNDQGGEGFLPASPLKEIDQLQRYSRNETFAAGSRAYLLNSSQLAGS